jgi:hypothetical protein
VALAARRSHLDLAPVGLRVLGAPAGGALPYAFGDAVARADVALGGGRALEASALGAWDRLWDDVPGIVAGTRGRWANAAARLTLTSGRGAVRARHTVGASRFRSGMALADSTTSPLPDFVANPCGCLQPVAGCTWGSPPTTRSPSPSRTGAGRGPRAPPTRRRRRAPGTG